jgi:hypothetical protein
LLDLLLLLNQYEVLLDGLLGHLEEVLVEDIGLWHSVLSYPDEFLQHA